jgi:hypothetical protein
MSFAEYAIAILRLACASHVAASCARHAVAFVPHIWPDVEILVALLWDLFLLPV